MISGIMVKIVSINYKKPFSCPHCAKTFPFWMILKVKKRHKFECPNCGGVVVPLRTKSFTWGFVIGFLSFALPHQIIIYLNQDIVLAFLIGLLHAIVTFGLVSLYLFCTTIFVKPSSYP